MTEPIEKQLERMQGELNLMQDAVKHLIKDRDAESRLSHALVAAVKALLEQVDVHSKSLVMLADNTNPLLSDPGREVRFTFKHLTKLHRL